MALVLYPGNYLVLSFLQLGTREFKRFNLGSAGQDRYPVRRRGSPEGKETVCVSSR